MQAQLKVEVQANTNTLPKAKFGKGRQHIAINQADKPVLSCQTVFFKSYYALDVQELSQTMLSAIFGFKSIWNKPKTDVENITFNTKWWV